LLDRIDLRIEVPAVSAADLIRPGKSEASATVAARVARARDLQRARFEALGADGALTNAQCPPSLIEAVATPDQGGMMLLQDASEKLGFSGRAYHRVLKVARTLADLTAARASAASMWRRRSPTAWRPGSWRRLHSFASGLPA
jgi:magnesium chelatase family protein